MCHFLICSVSQYCTVHKTPVSKMLGLHVGGETIVSVDHNVCRLKGVTITFVDRCTGGGDRTVYRLEEMTITFIVFIQVGGGRVSRTFLGRGATCYLSPLEHSWYESVWTLATCCLRGSVSDTLPQ